MKLEFDGEFRARWNKRREIAVEIISNAISGECVESQFDSLKEETSYNRLSSRDQANLRRFCSDVRAVWQGWSLLDRHERNQFLARGTVYSTLANKVRQDTA